MKLNQRELLDKIQMKREIMMKCAWKAGINDKLTIQHSQELDMLIYEYQKAKINFEPRRTREFKLNIKQYHVNIKTKAV
ncbi:aspartyl-phosphate phosphatase Spo0E family protein [Cytobacillus kochii]|uniref:aspartyl-phosphate phosphatase Spo0E family protein n=1 Tax=Cytobacillus kochii TaxID=859143 RepID=UPI001CD57290|nr:aspartyl-phosphate phosphatase Spo0E family protein [Cytobacillus kochii]MCA1027571.1 aspartyl-phosphate phosphatase Spo0E family protein [Cytobacillus kochii]